MANAEATAPPNGAAQPPKAPDAEESPNLGAPPPASMMTLFGTDDPTVFLERASKAANSLKSVLASPDFTSDIRGKRHVKVEGWQLVGAMFGYTPALDWTKRTTEPAKGWEARFKVQSLSDGRVVGAGEAMCDRTESKWKNSDDYAVRSMAQTRATSKALASVFRFIVTLAGYSGTPAEEMPTDDHQGRQLSPPPQEPKKKLDPKIVMRIGQGIAALKLSPRDIHLMLGAVGANGLRGEDSAAIKAALEALTPEQATAFEARLEAKAADTAAEKSQNGGETNE